MIRNSEIKHHFFGKECLINRELSDYSNLTKALKKLNFNYKFSPSFLNQIHSDKVITINNINQIYSKNNKPKADALVTNIKGLPIAVITADCVPIIFYDLNNSVIAVAHAGWKGAKKGIVEKTIENMLKIGAKIENINCLIGPCIRQESYEVSAEFYEDFLKENSQNQKFFINSKKANHFMFDLPSYVKEKIQNNNIRKINDTEVDNYKNSQMLFSYRRSCHLNEQDCGRNISVIIINH